MKQMEVILPDNPSTTNSLLTSVSNNLWFTPVKSQAEIINLSIEFLFTIKIL